MMRPVTRPDPATNLSSWVSVGQETLMKHQAVTRPWHENITRLSIMPGCNMLKMMLDKLLFLDCVTEYEQEWRRDVQTEITLNMMM